jgi:hypothetical protein
MYTAKHGNYFHETESIHLNSCSTADVLACINQLVMTGLASQSYCPSFTASNIEYTKTYTGCLLISLTSTSSLFKVQGRARNRITDQHAVDIASFTVESQYLSSF